MPSASARFALARLSSVSRRSRDSASASLSSFSMLLNLGKGNLQPATSWRGSDAPWRLHCSSKGNAFVNRTLRYKENRIEADAYMKPCETTVQSENAYQDAGTSPPQVHAWTESQVEPRSEEHTSELQSLRHLVFRLL